MVGVSKRRAMADDPRFSPRSVAEEVRCRIFLASPVAAIGVRPRRHTRRGFRLSGCARQRAGIRYAQRNSCRNNTLPTSRAASFRESLASQILPRVRQSFRSSRGKDEVLQSEVLRRIDSQAAQRVGPKEFEGLAKETENQEGRQERWLN